MGRVGKAALLGSFGETPVGSIGGQRNFYAQPLNVGPETDTRLLLEKMAETIR